MRVHPINKYLDSPESYCPGELELAKTRWPGTRDLPAYLRSPGDLSWAAEEA